MEAGIREPACTAEEEPEMKDRIRTCRKCGKRIGIIEWGIYRKSVVDPSPVMVIPDPDGEDYVRIDGSKVKARPASYENTEPGAEPAYRQHRKTCGTDDLDRPGWEE